MNITALSQTIHYENMAIQILPPKNENFQIKNSDIFHSYAQNIDCGYSLELPRRGPQSMFLSSKMKNNVYPCIPQLFFFLNKSGMFS